MRAISVWIFSKIVMLIFLFLVFGTVISFVKMTSERVAADAAASLTMQVQAGVQSALNNPAINAKIIVPLPKTLPEQGAEVTAIRKYTLVAEQASGSQLLSIAVAWGAFDSTTPQTVYVSASSLMLPAGTRVAKVVANSDAKRFIVICKSTSTSRVSLCLQGCRAVSPVMEECVPTSCRCQ